MTFSPITYECFFFPGRFPYRLPQMNIFSRCWKLWSPPVCRKRHFPNPSPPTLRMAPAGHGRLRPHVGGGAGGEAQRSDVRQGGQVDAPHPQQREVVVHRYSCRGALFLYIRLVKYEISFKFSKGSGDMKCGPTFDRQRGVWPIQKCRSIYEVKKCSKVFLDIIWNVCFLNIWSVFD